MPGTRCVSGRELRQMRESYEKEHGRRKGWQKMSQDLQKLLDDKSLRPQDFSIAESAEALIPDGREWLQSFVRPKDSRQAFMEAGNAVSTELFTQVMGQWLFTEFKDRYMDEEFVFMRSVDAKQSKIITGMERIPGVTRLGPEVQVVPEDAPYPMLGVGQDYIEIGPKQKRGFQVALTREAIAGDLTGQLLENAGEGAYWLGYDAETRVIDAIIDENAGAVSAAIGGHRYHWRGDSIANYGNNSGTHNWDNLQASNGLVDWTDIENAWQLLADITDPNTGAPILIQPDSIIVASDNLWTAKRIVSATEVRQATPGFATSANPNVWGGPNPVSMVLNNLQILSSRLFTSRIATDTTWFLGNPRKAVRRYYNWDIESEQAPANHPGAWERDEVTAFKVSVRDVVSVIEPRVLCQSTA